MSVTVFVPCDAFARALGANRIAAVIERQALERGLDLVVRRNGSRGMAWLEPLVEVETNDGRIGYGPVAEEDVASLFDAGFLTGGEHHLRAGRPEDQPFLQRQTRLTFERCGITVPTDIDDYRAHGGLRGLERALGLDPAAIVEEVTKSGLRGRGGAGFPTGIKWETVRKVEAGDANTSSATQTRATAAPSPTA
jgi:formate dehydrogenase iron-sulfur subunit